MAVSPEGIAVDGCYLTADDEVRHVMNISGDQVAFEARDATHRPYPWQWRPALTKATFASEVIEHVSCHWNPSFRSAKLPTS